MLLWEGVKLQKEKHWEWRKEVLSVKKDDEQEEKDNTPIQENERERGFSEVFAGSIVLD